MLRLFYDFKRIYLLLYFFKIFFYLYHCFSLIPGYDLSCKSKYHGIIFSQIVVELINIVLTYEKMF